MKLPQCQYPSEGACGKCAAPIKNTFNMLWTAFDGKIDMDNIDEEMFGSGLSTKRVPRAGGGTRRVVVVPIFDSAENAYIEQKADGTLTGLDLVTESKICMVHKDSPTEQVGSFVVESPVTEVNPTLSLFANSGKMRMGTTGAHAVEILRNGATITIEERTGSAAIVHDIRTVKFTNGTLLRTLSTASYTLNNLADILYTLAYDNKTTGTISGWTATASATYTFDLASFTANTLAAFLATVINDIQTNGYLSVSLYRCTTPRGRFALDCDSFTMNQLGQAVCAFMAELGVSGLEIGLATKQPLSTDLTAIAALTSAADKTIYATGAGTWATTTLTSFARTLIDDASSTDARSTLGLVIGTNVQAYHANLAAIAALTNAADKGIQFSGSGNAATYDLTTAGKALLDDTDAAEQRSTLGLVIGTNVQAYDSALADIAGIAAPSPGDVITYNGANWVASPGGGSLAVDDLTDVDAPAPNDGDILTWSTGDAQWIASAPTGGSGLTQPQVMARAFGGC